ncbi:DNA replication/repair protein RecF [Catellatospora bangladeshensis]|uniref:DNA replication and repair protein RecF n=1 Tax=Catellatospora bangladeshensis TaxID=310355 RepID=A0A8J3JT11_9ACTN|nr:DNA replication/repair protein RecF [Catellatospora bangladeshensis]GIF86377.1 DNA replication and repair protein RecF [Catellatospora bangladeshensis]
MYVRRLELVDVRSYPRVGVDLEPGPNVLIGPNGVGKTNLVEALGYVATLASHRVSTDAPLVRVGAATGVIRCAIVHESRELLVELEIVPGKANRARLGRSPARRPRDILGALRLVLFAPEDLALVRGEPDQRRRYLDDLLTARQPRFAAVRADYERVLKQRNALLRTAYLARKVGGGRGDLSTLQVWDQHLAEHGAQLLRARLALVEQLAPYLEDAYQQVSAGVGKAVAEYRASVPEPTIESMLAALEAVRADEIARGTTLAGPHRDDLVLRLGDLPVKGYASHGESWSYALALRLAGYALLRADGIEPVLILDDVFAELDTGRRDRLAHLIGDAAQVIITCAVEADVPASLRGARYLVAPGEVTRA